MWYFTQASFVKVEIELLLNRMQIGCVSSFMSVLSAGLSK
jgi:hypothetical protein